jgi:long-chain acyl-CoA synthetase
MSFNLATILTEAARATPGAPVCLLGGATTTYHELDEQSGRFAAGLRELGLRPGQVVAVQLPNVPQFLTAYFGVPRHRRSYLAAETAPPPDRAAGPHAEAAAC